MKNVILVLSTDEKPLQELIKSIEVCGYCVEICVQPSLSLAKVLEKEYCCILVTTDWPNEADTIRILRTFGQVALRLAPHSTGELDVLPYNADHLATCQLLEKAIEHYAVHGGKYDHDVIQATLLDTMDEGVIIVDGKEVITYANSAAIRMFGEAAGSLVGQSLAEYTHPEQFEVLCLMTQRRMTGERSSYIAEFVLRTGVTRQMRIIASPLMDRQGHYIGAMGVLRDITDEKMTRELAVSQSALALALSNTVAVLTSTLDINEVFDRILTNLELVVPHQAANIMLIENDLACIVRHRGYVERGWTGVLQVACLPWKEMPLLKRMVETGAPVFVPDTHLETDWKAHEAYQELRAYAATPIQIKGEVIGFLNLDSDQPGYFKDGDAERLAVFADQAAIAIENARLYSEVQRLAVCDDLTGMFNRRGLFEFGGRETERSLKDGTPLSVAWLDFDFFKKVNDSFGHEAGDIVLQQVARLCRRSLRSVDLVGRYGGDELVVILPNTDLSTAQKVCERLRGIISSSAFLVGDGEVHLTVSIGLAALNPDKPELNDVMNRADHAMYSAKAAGRDCVVLDAEGQP